jgi:diguanylate cyclase (GGDEF)-like protein/PAS domain S-box-containing protein
VLGQFACGLLAGDRPVVVLFASLFNTAEILAAAWPLRALITNARELSLPRPFLRFLAYAVLLAPLLSSLLFAGHLAVTGQFSARSLLGWSLGHALGMATVAPLTLALCGRNGLVRFFQRANLLELVLGVALIILTTVVVFRESQYPLLFLIFPPVMVAALRSGFAGTAFVLIIVAVIAAVMTHYGHGPLVLVAPEGSGINPYNILQVFIGVLLLTCFPVAVTMSALRHNQRSERKLRNRLRLLAEHSSDAIVLTDLDGRRLYASPQIREIIGQEPGEFLRGSFRDQLGPEHAATLQEQLAQMARRQGGKATITFPVRRADGTRRWVEARIKHFLDEDFMLLDFDVDPDIALNRGRSGKEGFIVTLRDVTRRHRAEQDLESANRKLASMAWKDGLTGLGNRRRFDQLLADGWEQCRLAQSPLSVIMVDVDHFKRYNDQYGHQEGDQCLLVVARTIAGCLRREQDCAARYGGEEFGLVLPGVGATGADEVAERIRQGLQQLELPHAGSPLGVVTVSVGTATCVPTGDGRPEDLVNAADRALYGSKAEGRNRVTITTYNAPEQS